jgi:imidazole glycerol-phosphate synthase subunit HisF
MLRPRLIPVLLVDHQLHLVKTTVFARRNYLGDPLNAAYVFSGFEVDELLVLDIDATPQRRSIPLRFVEALARFARVPLCVGGGITSIEQIHDLLALGVEKVVLSAVLKGDFDFLQQAAERFGSSTISVALNISEPSVPNDSDLALAIASFGRPDAGDGGQPLLDLARACQQAGAGELVLNYVQRDGTRTGYAVSHLAALNRQLTIPLVGLGGCGSHCHIAELLAASPLSGVAAGSLFAYAPDSREVLLNYPLTHKWLQQECS